LARGPARRRVLRTVGDDVAALRGDSVARVAVDGVDGAGKTVLADELARLLRERSVPVIRASVDGFHHPRHVRYRRGRDSPGGYYLDSYDYDALERLLLAPLGPGGDRRFVRAVYDVERERPVAGSVEVADPESILIFDGIFLHRPELRSFWDYSVFLDVPFEVSVARGAERHRGDPLADPDPEAEINRRYVAGQRRYLRECEPWQHATVVIDNTDLQRPRITNNHGATIS
jgi:uridine kinase